MRTLPVPANSSRARRHAPMFLTLARHPVRTLGATLRFFFSLRTPILPRLAALFAVAYLVWPVDLIPDVAPILGWLDDAGFATLAFGWVMKKVGEAEAARLPAPVEGSPDATEVTPI